MPLHTAIMREGIPLAVPHGWGGFHVAAMVIAAALDSGTGPFKVNTTDALLGCPYEEIDEPIAVSPNLRFSLVSYPALAATPLNDGSYTLRKDWSFIDPADSEVLALKAGDQLTAYRN